VRVCISLCTRNRPKMLRQCIDSINSSLSGVNFSVFIVVVENYHEDCCRSALENYSDLDIYYYLETKMGIPFARNRGIEEALKIGFDWLIFIDDDEFVSEDWLCNLVSSANKHEAEVITGPRIRIYPDTTPVWMPRNPGQNPETGTLLDTTYTANTMAAARLFEADGLAMRFDTRLRYTGGSDNEFFRRFTRMGGKIVWVREARLFEEVPEARATLSWHAERYVRMANNGVIIARLHGGNGKAFSYALPRVVGQVARGLARGILGLVLFIPNRDAGLKKLANAWMNFSSAYGFLLGALNIRSTPYKKIQGH